MGIFLCKKMSIPIKFTTRLFYAVITPAIILGLWECTCLAGWASPYLLPSPQAVWKTFLHTISTGELMRNASASLIRVFQGFTISAVSGCLAAWLLFNLPRLEKALDPALNFLRMTPPLATIPLLILWFGIGEATQLAIIVLASFFPIFLNARAGFARLDMPLRELALSLNLHGGRFTAFFALPAALPAIITGLRLGFGYSWRALIAAELIAAGSGLGYMIADAEQMQRVDVVIVGIFAIGLTGWALDAGFRRLVSLFFGKRFPELALR